MKSPKKIAEGLNTNHVGILHRAFATRPWALFLNIEDEDVQRAARLLSTMKTPLIEVTERTKVAVGHALPHSRIVSVKILPAGSDVVRALEGKDAPVKELPTIHTAAKMARASIAAAATYLKDLRADGAPMDSLLDRDVRAAISSLEDMDGDLEEIADNVPTPEVVALAETMLSAKPKEMDDALGYLIRRSHGSALSMCHRLNKKLGI